MYNINSNNNNNNNINNNTSNRDMVPHDKFIYSSTSIINNFISIFILTSFYLSDWDAISLIYFYLMEACNFDLFHCPVHLIFYYAWYYYFLLLNDPILQFLPVVKVSKRKAKRAQQPSVKLYFTLAVFGPLFSCLVMFLGLLSSIPPKSFFLFLYLFIKYSYYFCYTLQTIHIIFKVLTFAFTNLPLKIKGKVTYSSYLFLLLKIISGQFKFITHYNTFNITKPDGSIRVISYVSNLSYRVVLYIIKYYLELLYAPFILPVNFGYIKNLNGTFEIINNIIKKFR